MTVRVSIKQKPGVKPKLSTTQANEVIKSDIKADYLAYQYKVSVDTIYKIKRDFKKRKMSIPIVPEPGYLNGESSEYEDCILCGEQTMHWHLESNRPVCPLCSVKNNVDDIPMAQFNY